MDNESSIYYEVLQLRNENEQLKERLNKCSCDSESEAQSQVSKKEIINFVEEKILANENINMSYVPDSIEKEMYRKSALVLLSTIEEVLKTTKIEFMGHRITLKLEAKEKRD